MTSNEALLISDEINLFKSPIGKKIRKFEESLQCNICFDFFNNPQILSKCGHSFCSECIRTHFDQKLNVSTNSLCPQCKSKGDIYCLQPNRQLADSVNIYKIFRADLIKMLSNNNKVICSDDSKPSFKGENIGTKITKQLPCISFHHLKESKAKEMIKTFCGGSNIILNLNGDKNAIEKRYGKFRHLHNAQIDSPNPLTLEQVISKINNEELVMAYEARKDEKLKTMVNEIKNGKSNKLADIQFRELLKKAKASKQKVESQALDKNLLAHETKSLNNSEISDKDKVCSSLIDNSLISTVDVQEDTATNRVSVEEFSEKIETTTDRNENISPCSARFNLENVALSYWRVILKENKHHFYNISTKKAQIEVPEELMITLSDDSMITDKPNFKKQKLLGVNEIFEILSSDSDTDDH